jgi:methyltransferase (TIGR00027 family)
MSERLASTTALGVAMQRAAHQLLDDAPKVLDDSVVVRLLGERAVERLRADVARYRSPEATALRAHVVLRSRWAEDRLAAAVARGVGQYVVLGAGFDTFAYRQPAWARPLAIVEVDQPATQRRKAERLVAAGIAIPPNTALVPIDFEVESLAAGLARQRFDAHTPTFVACLGVFMYLTAEAIDAVFRFVATLPGSSELVFTFASSEAGSGALAARAAAVGEPWQTRLDAERLRRELPQLGFSTVAFLEPDEAARYFRGRGDGLAAPRRTNIVSVTV